MAQLPKGGLHGSCATYFPGGISILHSLVFITEELAVSIYSDSKNFVPSDFTFFDRTNVRCLNSLLCQRDKCFFPKNRKLSLPR